MYSYGHLRNEEKGVSCKFFVRCGPNKFEHRVNITTQNTVARLCCFVNRQILSSQILIFRKLSKISWPPIEHLTSNIESRFQKLQVTLRSSGAFKCMWKAAKYLWILLIIRLLWTNPLSNQVILHCVSQGVEIIALRGNIAVFYERVVQMAIEGFFYAVQVLHNRELPKRDLSLPIQIWQRFLSHAFTNRDRKELTNYLSLPCLRCDLQCKQASWGQVSETGVSWHHRNPT